MSIKINKRMSVLKWIKPFVPATTIGGLSGVGGTIFMQQWLSPPPPKSSGLPPVQINPEGEKIIAKSFTQLDQFLKKSKWNIVIVLSGVLGVGLVWRLGWNKIGWITKRTFRKAMSAIQNKIQSISQKITDTEKLLEKKILSTHREANQQRQHLYQNQVYMTKQLQVANEKIQQVDQKVDKLQLELECIQGTTTNINMTVEETSQQVGKISAGVDKLIPLSTDANTGTSNLLLTNMPDINLERFG